MKSVSPRHLLRRLLGATAQSQSKEEPVSTPELPFSDAKAYVEKAAKPTSSTDDTKFIISCAARTGSTMLVHLLRANPNILCHGEVYGGETLGSIWGKYRQLREEDENFDRALHRMAEGGPEDFLNSVVFDNQGRQAVGFKYKTDESLGEWRDTITKFVAADRDIKVIHLIRKDLLDQFISHHVVTSQTSVTFAHKAEDIPEAQPFTVEPDYVLDYLKDVQAREEQSLEVYQGHELYTVSYEDLVAEKQEVHNGLQEFLGLTPSQLHTTTKKLIPDNKVLLINRDEVMRHLQENGFGDRIGHVCCD